MGRVGVTFAYANRKPAGLLMGEKAIFITAFGGTYDEGSALASLNFVQPYLRAVFGFAGLTDTSCINAGNTAALLHGADRTSPLEPHLAAINDQLTAA